MNCNRRKATTMGLITSMLLSLVLIGLSVNVAPVSAQATTVYIDPPSITVPVCTEFTVYLKVKDVVDLYAWQTRLRFDPNLLECKGAGYGPFLPPPTIDPIPVINNVEGWVLIGNSRMVPPGASGSGTLAYFKFHCKGPGSGVLRLDPLETFLLDSNLNSMPCTKIDASVTQYELEATLYIDPPSLTVPACNNFTVNVNIKDVKDLYGWQVNITFNPTLMTCLSVTEGPFLKSVGPTLFFVQIGPGYVLAACTLMPPVPQGASGSGTLASITFHCIEPGSCALHFDPVKTMLIDHNGFKIPYVAVDGSVTQVLTALHGEDGLFYSVHLHADFLINLYDPICTYWHELWPYYCKHYYHLNSWEDNNGDDMLSPSDQIDMIDMQTEQKTWWHVDDVTVTIYVKPIEGPPPPMYIESTGGFNKYSLALMHPMNVTWHEIYPVFSKKYIVTSWVDNGDGILSYCDKILVYDPETGLEAWFHVEQVSTDITVTRKPICTQWHEIYPDFCSHSYHLSSWIDNGDHELSYCDKIDLTDKVTGKVSWWHVTSVTVTMVLTEKYVPPPIEQMYVEYIPIVLSPNPVPPQPPVCTYWHEIWPVYCRYYHLTSWEDNGDGWLSPSDQIDMTDEQGYVHYYHVDDISIDIWIEPLPQPVHDVAVIKVEPKIDPTVVQGDTAPVEVTVQNQGDYTETFGVTAYADLAMPIGDEITIGTQTVSLGPGLTTVLTFNWDTTGVPVGTYTISAVADVVPGETDIADNTFIDGTVTVTQYLYLHGEDGLFYSVRLHADPPIYPVYYPISTYWHELWPYYCNYYHLSSWEDTNRDERLSPSDQIDMITEPTREQWNEFWSMGDVDRSGHIGPEDIDLIMKAFGSRPGDPRWDPRCDLNQDLVVDATDLMICSKNQCLFIMKYFDLGKKSWWHVDDVTVTLWLRPEEPGYEPMYIDCTLGYKAYDWILYDPLGTPWHEIWPKYCTKFTLTSWIDSNANGVVDFCDYVDLTDETGIVTWWHVEQVTTDITVTRKPICTQWHEIFPQFCKNDYHLRSWNDTNGDHKLSPCDIIDIVNKKTKKLSWWHVVDVTITIKVTSKDIPMEPLYFEFMGGFPRLYDPLTTPICTYWHEIWPIFSRERHLTSWIDNGDGWLSPSDQIDMTPISYPGPIEYYHVDDVMIDIILEPVQLPCPKVEWTHTFAKIDYFMTFCPSPGVANIDKDLPLEIVTGTDEWYGFQKWHCFDHTGAYQWMLPTGCDESRTSVAIGDIDGDGDLEFAGGCTSGWETQVFSSSGSFVWRYPRPAYFYDWWHSSPAMCDVYPEVAGLEVIAVRYFAGMVYCFDKNGNVLWTFATGATNVDASPACGDVDGDGSKEIIIGVPDNRGTIYCLNGRTGAVKWTHQSPLCPNRNCHSSAAIADIDNDGMVEVIVGKNDGGVYCLKGTTGAAKWIYGTGGSVYSSPAIGDVDNDGVLEIIVGSNDDFVHCINGIGGVCNFEWSYQTHGDVISSPALANRGGVGLAIYVGSKDSKLYALSGTGALIWSYSTGATNGITSSAAVADIDGDKKLEVMFSDWNAIPDSSVTTNKFWVLEDCGSLVPPYKIEWAMFRHDRCHTGKYSSGITGMASATSTQTTTVKGSNQIQLINHDVAIVFDWLSKSFIKAGETVQVYVDIENQGTVTESTTVNVYYDGNLIGSQNVLNLLPGETRTLTFNWDTTGVPKGTYSITAVANVVPGETDTFDNTFSTLAIVTEPVHDVAIASVKPWKTVVCQGFPCPIDVTVINQGDYPEAFALAATQYSTVIATQAVTLNPGEVKTIKFIWNVPPSTPKGLYEIRAYILTPILGETDILDNKLYDGSVRVSMKGDLTGPTPGVPDGKCDIRDCAFVALGYGALHITDPTSPKYCQYWHTPPCKTCPHSANIDFNCDGKIDIKDLVVVALNYGKIDP